MVLNFSNIPLNLQVKIAEKVGFYDLKQLNLSSKDGKNVINLINLMPVVETTQIRFESKGGTIYIKRPDSMKPVQKSFFSLSRIPQLPRLLVTAVEPGETVTPECFADPFVNAKYRFVQGDVDLQWSYGGPAKAEIVHQLTKKFNITGFSALNVGFDALEESFLSLPVFKQIKKINFLGDTIPDHLFLKFAASKIFIGPLSSYPASGSAMNTFLKQWCANKRTISTLYLSIHTSDPSMLPETLLSGMDYKLLWSLETHDTSDYAHIPKTDLKISQNDKFYLIYGEDKKLALFILDETMMAQEVLEDDVNLLGYLTPKVNAPVQYSQSTVSKNPFVKMYKRLKRSVLSLR